MTALVAIGVEVLHQLWQLLPFLALGLVLEVFVRVHDRFGFTRLGLNGVSTVVYLAAQVTFGLLYGPAILGFAQRLPGAGVLTFSVGVAPLWPVVLVGALAYITLRDLLVYWVHRAQHRVPWLWALHQLHHNDDHLNVTTSLRLHWLDVPLQWLTVFGPLEYLCRPAPALLLAIWGLNFTLVFFSHLDVPWGFGRWNPLIITPQTHRIHHSALAVHRDRNFAGICPLWDVLFGTYYAPAPGEYPPTGLITPGEPPWRVLLLPVQTWRGRWRG